MSQPSITYYNITSMTQGAAQADQIRKLNHGGAVGTAISNATPLDFGGTEAGYWATPKVFVVQFQNSTAKSLTLRLFQLAGTGAPRQDPVVDSQGETLVPYPWYAQYYTNWQFNMTLQASWTDPTSISTDPSSTPITGWTSIASGTNPATSIDSMFSNLYGGGNDGTTHLLVQDTVDSTKTRTNFFIYISVLPVASALAGTDTGWGFQLGYIFPGDPLS